MTKLELIQYIGNEVCEGCVEGADCGLPLIECGKLDNAINELNKYLEENKKPEQAVRPW